MPHQLPTLDEIVEALDQRIEQKLGEKLPKLLRKANRKKWINTKELQEYTGWSARTIQYMRDKKRIPYFQEGRRILYKVDEIDKYLQNNKITPKGQE